MKFVSTNTLIVSVLGVWYNDFLSIVIVVLVISVFTTYNVVRFQAANIVINQIKKKNMPNKRFRHVLFYIGLELNSLAFDKVVTLDGND